MTNPDDLGGDPAESSPEPAARPPEADSATDAGGEAASASDASRPSRRAPRQRGSRALTIVGILLLVAGLSCLGWVGYQYFGTNIVSSHKFQTEKDALRDKWRSESPSSAKPTKTDPTLKEQPTVIPGDAIALLRIPAFGSDFEVPILSGTDLDILSRGVGHYIGTADPGQIGNFAVAGHRITHGQPFAKLLQLKKGDQIVVETRDAIFTYALDASPADLTVNDSATWVLDPVPEHPDVRPTTAMITLTTCQDLFHSPDRSIGFGHLESTKIKG